VHLSPSYNQFSASALIFRVVLAQSVEGGKHLGLGDIKVKYNMYMFEIP
jgi:hypothetical protein